MAVKQRTRNIALTPFLDNFVETKIKSGRYQSASEVVRESLRIMEQREAAIRRQQEGIAEAIRIGYDELRGGDSVDAASVFDEITSMSKTARTRGTKSK